MLLECVIWQLLEVLLENWNFSFFIAQLKAQSKLEATLTKQDEKEEVDTKGKTYLQLLKEKRDYKRRRQKYRARNVHVTRRTPKEVSVDKWL